MLPNPLHPALVHFPIVLAVLAPVVLGVLWYFARRPGANPKLWLIAVAFAATLTASAWASNLTGEAQEERVEDVVAEASLEAHEEAAQLLVVGSAALLVLVAVGLLRGPVGKGAQMFAMVASLALVVASWRAGHTGGQLVYGGNAASAYSQGAVAGASADDDEERERW